MDHAFERSHCFAPRPIEFLGVREYKGGWRLKTYSIVFGDASLDAPMYEEGFTQASAQLPQPAATPVRPGVGFVIFHQGRGAHYLVLGWWDRENEIPLRVLVREFGRGASWRAAGPSESVCVWDLEVLWHERQAYVRHILGPPQGPDLDAYLSDRLDAS